MIKIKDYYFYSKEFHKIRTKMDGLKPFTLRDYQRDFIEFVQSINGPKRIIALKPRQAGFSTLVASYFAWKFCTNKYYSGLLMADKKSRTQEVAGIYHTFLEKLPKKIMPMVSVNNSERLWLDNPREAARKELPGLGSGLIFETANDPNAGRSGTRKFAHMTEAAFYKYASSIDEGVLNSIHLHRETCIIKESTANGRAGDGKAFYDLWNAAKRGDSIFKAFFVPWYKIDDYQLKPAYDFRPTEKERDILKQFPNVTEANLTWRRLKVMEYSSDEEQTILTPEERFCQDFPLDDQEAFLSTGAPVFDIHKVTRLINSLTSAPPAELQERVRPKGAVVSQYLRELKIYQPPRQGKSYYVGADVAEGLAMGDASSVFIVDDNDVQVCEWHGKIDPDLYGHLLVDLGDFYNKALITVEMNNMGHTTVTTIRNSSYPKLYREKVEDQIEKKIVTKYGWRTTSKSKMVALNLGVSAIRESSTKILSVRLAEELANISRGENGGVNMNGKDRAMAFCLALAGKKHYHIDISTSTKTPKVFGKASDIHKAWEQSKKKKKDDCFD